MADKLSLDALRERGTSPMMALSAYAQACLAFAAVREGGLRKDWEDRAAEALMLVVEIYG